MKKGVQEISNERERCTKLNWDCPKGDTARHWGGKHGMHGGLDLQLGWSGAGLRGGCHAVLALVWLPLPVQSCLVTPECLQFFHLFCYLFVDLPFCLLCVCKHVTWGRKKDKEHKTLRVSFWGHVQNHLHGQFPTTVSKYLTFIKIFNYVPWLVNVLYLFIYWSYVCIS